MALDLADVARRAAELGGEEAVASVSLRKELVVRASPEGVVAPPRRTFDVLVRLMVRDGAGRIGIARCSCSLRDPQLESLAAQAHAQAAAALTDLRPLPAVAPGADHEGHDPATAALDPLHAAGAARQAAASIEMAVGRDRHACWRSEEVELAVAGHDGALATDRRTGVVLEAEALDADGGLIGWAQGSSPRMDELDAVEIGRRASPLPLPRGGDGAVVLADVDEPVVLLPPALAPLLSALGRCAFTGHSHAIGTSPFTGRSGLPVAGAGITLTDAPRYLHTLSRAIDIEGVPATAVRIIEDGVLVDVVHDSRSAAEAGTGASTGHAGELGGTPSGAHARNLVLEPGDAAGVDALVMPVDRGVVVGRVDRVVAAGPGSTRFTAIGRAAYAVERGVPVALLGDVLLTGDLVDVLATIDGLTAQAELVAALHRLPERTAAVVCPAVRTAGVRILA